jgi:hypothetical protein
MHRNFVLKVLYSAEVKGSCIPALTIFYHGFGKDCPGHIPLSMGRNKDNRPHEGSKLI